MKERLNHAERILKLIQNHGLSVVLLVVLIFWGGKKIDQLWDVFLTQNQSIRQIQSEISEKKIDQEYITNDNRINDIVNSELRKMLDISHAQKAAVFQLHNGKKNAAGMQFLYYSLTHQVCAAGIQNDITPKFQNMPVSYLVEYTQRFIKKYAVHDNTDFWLLSQWDTKEIHAVPLYDSNDNLFGFIIIGYIFQYNYDPLIARKMLYPASLKISGALLK